MPLIKKNMIITEYASKFTQLSRYASHMVANEKCELNGSKRG